VPTWPVDGVGDTSAPRANDRLSEPVDDKCWRQRTTSQARPSCDETIALSSWYGADTEGPVTPLRDGTPVRSALGALGLRADGVGLKGYPSGYPQAEGSPLLAGTVSRATTRSVTRAVAAIHNLCATPVEKVRRGPFHVKRRRWTVPSARSYPQPLQRCDVAFHVKRGCLWITPVDNFGSTRMPTDGDLHRRPCSPPNG
jgi:hypothetical protein